MFENWKLMDGMSEYTIPTELFIYLFLRLIMWDKVGRREGPSHQTEEETEALTGEWIQGMD